MKPATKRQPQAGKRLTNEELLAIALERDARLDELAAQMAADAERVYQGVARMIEDSEKVDQFIARVVEDG